MMTKVSRWSLALAIALLPATFFLGIVLKAPVLVILVVIGICYRYGRAPPQRWTHGTARFANESDLRRCGMIGANTGLIVGRLQHSRPPPVSPGLVGLIDPTVDSAKALADFGNALTGDGGRRNRGELVRLSRAVHTAVFAPTGTGKSTGLVIPFLKHCPEPCVVVDFKGELARATAEWRRRVFGHRCVFLDPFRIYTRNPDSLNPFDGLDVDSWEVIDDLRAIAEAFVVRTGEEKEPHWSDSAEHWIFALLAAVLCFADEGKRNLSQVREVFTNPAKLKAMQTLMCGSDAWDGMLARAGNQLNDFVDRELSSTKTTVNRHLKFLDTLAVNESIQTSSFNPEQLRQGRMTIYLILPPHHARTQTGLLRMWITILMRAIIRGPQQERMRTHFVLDETAGLGRMDIVLEALDRYRAWGIRLQLYLQSMGQLRSIYREGQDQGILSNTTQIFFGVNDLQTADYVSSRLGERTIVVDSGGRGGGHTRQHQDTGPGSSSYSSNTNSNWSPQGRALLKKEEVMQLPLRTAITFAVGCPPICTTMIRDYEEPFVGFAVTKPVSRQHAIVRLIVCLAAMFVSMWISGHLLLAVDEQLRPPRQNHPQPGMWDFSDTVETGGGSKSNRPKGVFHGK